MSTQYETVNVVIAGANPQNIAITVPVDTTSGTGSATLTYTATNGGSDSIQGTATIAGSIYSSNSASVNWQQSNGNIQIGSVVSAAAWNDSPSSGPVAGYIWKNPSDGGTGIARTVSSAPATQQNSSFAFDAYRSNAAGDNPQWSSFNAAGVATSYISFPPYGSNFNCCITGYILVPAPGTYNLTLTYKDGSLWGIGNSATGASPSWSGKGSITGTSGQTVTVALGLPLLPSPQNNGSGGYIGSSTVAVTFSQAGVYPIEDDWDYWYHSGRVSHITSGTGELAPITLISAPPPSTPTGNLTITPGGGVTNLQVVGQPITLSINVSGIVYPTKSYCPVFEGVTGNLFLFNDPSSSTFTFPTYNGQAVTKSAAASSVFKLSSLDNTAYQGLFSIGYDGQNFTLNYNGNTANPTSSSRVISTSLLVQADDIAWFNSTNSTFDTFSLSGSSGGTSYNLEIDYMNNPSVASISPTTIGASGGSYTLSIALNKAFSPQQQGAKNTGNSVNATCSITGATSTGTPAPILDSNGWLTGWNVPFTAPVATSNQTLTVNLTVSGTLTYLSGSAFVTTTVTYISGALGTITANGSSYVAPSVGGFSASPTGPNYLSGTGTVTLSATVFTAGSADPLTCNFFTQVTGQSSTTVLGAGSLQTSSPAIVGGVSGYLQTFTFSFNSDAILLTGNYLGFIATSNLSGLSCTYTSTASYSTQNSTVGASGNFSGGGGGGGGIQSVN